MEKARWQVQFLVAHKMVRSASKVLLWSISIHGFIYFDEMDETTTFADNKKMDLIWELWDICVENDTISET